MWDEHFRHLPAAVRRPLFDDYVEEITAWVLGAGKALPFLVRVRVRITLTPALTLTLTLTLTLSVTLTLTLTGHLVEEETRRHVGLALARDDDARVLVVEAVLVRVRVKGQG